MLKSLCNAFGVSGCEDEVRNIIVAQMNLKCDKITVDNMGNVICFKKGTKGYSNNIMLSCHMDEVGLIVTGITKDGYIRFKPVGGVDSRVLVSKRVIIGSNKIKGVIGAKPAHLIKRGESNVLKIKDLYIDIGAKNAEDAKNYVKLGDYIAFDSEYIEFGNGCIKAKALDDRVGCKILMDLAEHSYPNDIYFTFTVQEEVGCRGASVAAYNTSPDFAIVVEGTTCSDVPGTDDHSFSTRFGNGAAVSILDNGSYADKNISKAMYDIALKHNIKVQYKQTTMGGNDASAIHISGNGVKTAAISVPCRYIHSPSSVASLDDINSCYNILYNLLKEEGQLWSF